MRLHLLLVQAARSLDTLMKGIATRLKGYTRAFPVFDSLHPFEQSLMQLSVGAANYNRIVGNFDKLRKAVNQVCVSSQSQTRCFFVCACCACLCFKWKLTKRVLQVGKAYAANASNARTLSEAERVQEEGIEMLREVVLQRGKGIFREGHELSKKMRKLPQIDLFVPTVRSPLTQVSSIPAGSTQERVFLISMQTK